MTAITITEHAYLRGRERFNLGKKSLERLADKAYALGVRRRDSCGTLRRYYDEKRQYSNCLRIYGDYVFAFNNHVLVTCYRLPSEMVKFVKKPTIKRRQKHEGTVR